MTPVMDNSHSYPPPHVQPMYQGFAPTSYNANVQRKKQMRATQVSGWTENSEDSQVC